MLFHPNNNTKFKSIFTLNQLRDLNDQVVEHIWRKLNRMSWIRSLNKHKFKLRLIVFEDYHNDTRVNELINDGYHFVSIDKFVKLRTFANCDIRKPTMEN